MSMNATMGNLERLERYAEGLANDSPTKTSAIDVALFFGSMLTIFQRDRVANWLQPIYEALWTHEEWALYGDGKIRHVPTGIMLGIRRKSRWWWPRQAIQVEVLAPVKIEADRLNWRVHWIIAPMCSAVQCHLLHEAFSGQKSFTGSGDGI
jgi:hypothetical protein